MVLKIFTRNLEGQGNFGLEPPFPYQGKTLLFLFLKYSPGMVRGRSHRGDAGNAPQQTTEDVCARDDPFLIGCPHEDQVLVDDVVSLSLGLHRQSVEDPPQGSF